MPLPSAPLLVLSAFVANKEDDDDDDVDGMLLLLLLDDKNDDDDDDCRNCRSELLLLLLLLLGSTNAWTCSIEQANDDRSKIAAPTAVAWELE